MMVYLLSVLENDPVIFWTVLAIVVYILMRTIDKIEILWKTWSSKTNNHNHIPHV